MKFNYGAIWNKYGTLRRGIVEQSSCEVVTVGERCSRWEPASDVRAE